MADTKLYKVAITPCGKYVHGTEYDRLCLVLNATEDGGDGCSYVSLQKNKNVKPGTDSSIWALSLERGEQGERGPSGAGFSDVEITVSDTTGTPSGTAVIANDTLYLSFSGMRGAPGEIDEDQLQEIESAISAKQDALVSGTNIKTIGGQSILGSGNIQVGDENAVKFVSQSLTDSQKTQARTNIGAGTYSKPATGIPISDLADDVVPDISIGTVTTGAAGSQAEASITGTPAAPVLNLKIPQGAQGNSGYTGAAGELEVVNNLEDGGETSALSAEMGVVLQEYLRIIYDSLGAGAFWGNKPVIDWGGNSVPVSLSLVNCTIDNMAASASLGDSYEATITPDAGNVLANVSCTMGGESQTVTNGYIYIPEVTGTIIISATGANLDSLAYDGKTYRQIFETNNKLVSKGLSAGFDNGSYSPATAQSGSPAITSSEYDTPNYSLDCTSSGESSQIKLTSITGIASVNIFIAARVKVTSHTHGKVGIVHYSNTAAAFEGLTNGWVSVSAIVNEQATNCFLGAFNKDGVGATLTGYVDSPVLILMSSFSVVPTKEALTALYEEYINIKKAS